MSDISHAGFFYAHTGERFSIFQRLFANVGNDFFSLVHGHSLQNRLRLFCRRDRFVHIREYSHSRFDFRAEVQLGYDFFHNVLNCFFVQHSEISLNLSLPNAASAVSCSADPPLTPKPPTILPSISRGSPPPKMTILP